MAVWKESLVLGRNFLSVDRAAVAAISTGYEASAHDKPDRNHGA